MSDFFSFSANLHPASRNYLNNFFTAIEEHAKSHRRRYTVALGNNQFDTVYGASNFLGIELVDEEELFDSDQDDEGNDILSLKDRCVCIKCFCGQEWFTDLQLLDEYGTNHRQLYYALEGFVEKINIKYVPKGYQNKDNKIKPSEEVAQSQNNPISMLEV